MAALTRVRILVTVIGFLLLPPNDIYSCDTCCFLLLVDVMFREREKIDTDLSPVWRMAALLASSLSLSLFLTVLSTLDKSPEVFGFEYIHH